MENPSPSRNELIAELRASGAAPGEDQALASLAESVAELRGAEPSLPKPSYAPRSRSSLLRWTTATLGLTVGVVLVAFAQTSEPGSALYPVKRLSEQISLVVQPGYRDAIMDRRAQEVKDLVRDHRSPTLVGATLAAYRSDMASYRGHNYPAVEYCRDNLKQAQAMSSGATREQITLALAQIPDED
jgi:hypothetical protein